MADIDPVSVNYFLAKKTKFNFPLDAEVFDDVKNKLSKLQIEKIMADLGNYLGEINKIKGNGFGLVDPRALDKGELIGGSKSWYDFWKENFDLGFKEMDKRLKIEKRDKKYKLMYELLDRRQKFYKIFKDNKELINESEPRFLNGNVYIKNITVRNGKFVGLIDFSKALLGDPVDELAYFSIMPGCSEYLSMVLKGWTKKVNVKNFEERYHIHRLIESYRKIFTRYLKHNYLDKYPEPLFVAAEELSYYNSK